MLVREVETWKLQNKFGYALVEIQRVHDHMNSNNPIEN